MKESIYGLLLLAIVMGLGAVLGVRETMSSSPVRGTRTEELVEDGRLPAEYYLLDGKKVGADLLRCAGRGGLRE